MNRPLAILVLRLSRDCPIFKLELIISRSGAIQDPKEPRAGQGCQMVYFLTKNPNLGTFLRKIETLEIVVKCYVHLEYFTDIG
jgi:hypothetical protein